MFPCNIIELKQVTQLAGLFTYEAANQHSFFKKLHLSLCCSSSHKLTNLSLDLPQSLQVTDELPKRIAQPWTFQADICSMNLYIRSGINGQDVEAAFIIIHVRNLNSKSLILFFRSQYCLKIQPRMRRDISRAVYSCDSGEAAGKLAAL